MEFLPEDLIRILAAVVVGGLIGLEREFRDKAAGFRTLIFICVGATLFTLFSAKLAGDRDPTRIAANIVSGVGFLGAGVILRDGGRVVGLTTAAMIWLTAALGMGLGGGQYTLVGAVTGVILIVLWFFPFFEHWLDRTREERTYELVFPASMEKFTALEKLFRQSGLRIYHHQEIKAGAVMRCAWHTVGSLKTHEQLARQLFADADLQEFRF